MGRIIAASAVGAVAAAAVAVLGVSVPVATAGGPPQLTFSPVGVSFGPVDANTTTLVKQLTVRNSGGSGTGQLKVTVGGANAARFAMTTDTCTGVGLGPNKTCNVGFAYTPTTTSANDSASVVVTSTKPLAVATAMLTGSSNPPPNHAPVAVNDSFTTNENHELTGNVLANDSDPDGDPLEALGRDDGVHVSGPSHGTVSLRRDGSFTYTPDANFNGVDEFGYAVWDGKEITEGATVTITVLAVNGPPVAVNDSYITRSDTSLSVPAPGYLDNDVDPEDDPIIGLEVDSSIPCGALLFFDDGTIQFIPTEGHPCEGGEIVFVDYQASDGSELSNTALVTITVQPPPEGG